MITELGVDIEQRGISSCDVSQSVQWVKDVTICFSISISCCWKICMKIPSSSFSFPYCMFLDSTVWSAFPYSWLIFKICNAYAESGLFVLMYLVCSQCIAIHLPVCPTYRLLQELHFSLYIPLEFIVFCGTLSQS
jgi:hypothetical protein